IRVETPWEGRHQALGALRRMVDPPSPPSCVRLERAAVRSSTSLPWALAPMEVAGDGPPTWAVASANGEAEGWGVERWGGAPVWFQYQRGADGSRSANLVDVKGTSRTWTPAGEERPGSPVP